MALAVVFGSVVNLAAVAGFPRFVMTAAMLSFAALVFLVTALPALAAAFPWVARLRLPAPRGFIEKASRALTLNPAGWRGYALGLVLGLMPCGLVISALFAAATADSPVLAALAMGAFGAGTLPALMLTGMGGHLARRRWPVQVQKISGLILAFNAAFLIWLAAQSVI